MTIRREITRHCEILTRKSKQSISVALESYANLLLYANLRLDLLIRFWVIYFLCLLKSRDLDCHAEPKARLAMTNKVDCFGDKSPRNDGKRRESAIRFAMTNKTHPLAPSAREGEIAELPHAREGGICEIILRKGGGIGRIATRKGISNQSKGLQMVT